MGKSYITKTHIGMTSIYFIIYKFDTKIFLVKSKFRRVHSVELAL